MADRVLLSDIDGSVVDKVVSSGQSAQPVGTFIEARCEIKHSAACVDGQELVVVALDANGSSCYSYLYRVSGGAHFATGWHFERHKWYDQCVRLMLSAHLAFAYSTTCRPAKASSQQKQADSSYGCLQHEPLSSLQATKLNNSKQNDK